jgi:hypothetical protein
VRLDCYKDICAFRQGFIYLILGWFLFGELDSNIFFIFLGARGKFRYTETDYRRSDLNDSRKEIITNLSI